jgi:1-pyrroline-5-carboxylate dehydrogenase
MDRGDFRNEAFTDFKKAENKAAMEAALALVAGQFGRHHDLLIGGKRVKTEGRITSHNPSRKDQVVGSVAKATKEHVGQAIEAAAAAFETWKKTPAATRSELLFKGADALRKRRHEFSAVMVYEVGKTWPEADADTAEAIDFLDFYARENLRYSGPQPVTPVPGEQNRLTYLPLGVGLIVPPWNFPLAIMAGMTTAAIVTGNTVILKPSSESPIIAAEFVELLESVGLPPGVVNFLPGSGAEVGDPLVAHPLTRFVGFTGSKEVGLHLNELAARPQPGQRWIKRVVAEMGGKDAIVVDHEVDIDEAVAGVVASAFGFQGQKCSACSRAIVDESIYDEFLKRLKVRVDALVLGPAEDPKTDVGPVVSSGAYRSIQEYIAVGQKEGRLLSGGEAGPTTGYYLKPTVFADIAPKARLAQEEIFGPVLAVIKAKDFDDALAIANNTEFGLTGAVYSKNPAKVEQAKREFFVGNLYINRKCTGALVGGHPFGGFNMSGTDSKAGGRDYLLLFLQAQSIAEKVHA